MPTALASSSFPSPAGVCSAGWDDLHVELDAWAAAGRPARFWWRDDDASAPSPQLDRLFRIAEGAPLVLAVVPAMLDRALSLPGGVRVIQHGWAHANHAPTGAKKAELGDHRPAAAMLAELAQGRERLTEAFGSRFSAVLAPPWNRIGRVAARIGEAGLEALSLFGSRIAAPLPHRNVDADLLFWRPAPHFAGAGPVLGQIVARMRALRTEGREDGAVGLMTHHRVHDAASWAFLARFAALLRAHPGAAWHDPWGTTDGDRV